MDVPGGHSAALQQVSQFWSVLDEMSLNNPGAYKTFIERQLSEGVEYYSPPQPHCCLRTPVQKPDEGVLYVNVVGWKRVPAPTSHTQPVPVCVEDWKQLLQRTVYIVDVAFNPEVLQRAEEETQEKEQIHLLALSFVQQQHKLNLSQHFSVTKAKLKGSIQDVKCRPWLHIGPNPAALTNKQSPPPSLIQKISSLRMEESKEDSTIQLSVGLEKRKAQPGLIEVISSTESAQPQQPKHHVIVYTKRGSLSRCVKLRVELPGVCSVSQCQLSITQNVKLRVCLCLKDDILLEVEELYHLHLRFPERVNEETCCATYNKKKCVLTVTASVL